MTYPVVQMAKAAAETPQKSRKVVVPVFGKTLTDLRGRFTLGQVVVRVGCSTSYLHQLEKGTVLAPDPVFLEKLANLYGVSFVGLIRLLRWNRENPSATEHPKGPLEEGDMRVIGEDRYFIDRFRKLSAQARREVLNFIDFKSQHPEVAAAASFPESRRARKAPR